MQRRHSACDEERAAATAGSDPAESDAHVGRAVHGPYADLAGLPQAGRSRHQGPLRTPARAGPRRRLRPRLALALTVRAQLLGEVVARALRGPEGRCLRRARAR